jgi:L-amino acid N-acyltransferase YncA
MTAIIRDAEDDDLPAILAIHNDAVLHGTAIWSTVPVDLGSRRAVLADRRARGYPFLVAEVAGAVAGYASYGDFRPFDGYFKTVEHSVYVDPAHQRRSIATGLLLALIERAAAGGKHVMIGGITADNAPSLALHLRHGFAETGRLPQVGFKFGRYLDLVFMQKILD